MKNIISCQYCKSIGIKQNLAELLPNGLLKIPRHDVFAGDGWEREFTIIAGNDLNVLCGKCGNVAYKKQSKEGKEGKEEDEISNNRQQGLYRFTLIEATIRLGTPSYTNYAGTFI